MSTDWIRVNKDTRPPLAKPLLVFTADGKWTRAHWVCSPFGMRWIDDNSIPIKSAVTHYAEVVAPVETA